MNKEDQLRAFLRHFYNHSNTPVTLSPDSIKGIHPSNYACLFNHLKARGLLTGTMHPNSGGELPVVVTAQITHNGIQAIDKGLPLAPTFPSRLHRFLAHPMVTGLAGGAVGAILTYLLK